jgi:large subunit ribosomal protein L29
MKAKEVHELSDEALVQRGGELREQLFRLRFKQQLGNTDVVHQIQVARKDLARIKTELRARELKGEEEAGTRLPRRLPREKRLRRTRARANAAARAAARAS